MSGVAAAAHEATAAPAGESLAWPQDVDHTPTLTIGRVTEELRREFPALTQSKIRFLEDEQLVTPSRSESGYRKYSRADVERLRFILMRQRDFYAPLRVIKDDLRAMDAGHVIEVPRAARVVSSEGRAVAPSGRSIPARELSELTGVGLDQLEKWVSMGLIQPDLGGYFAARTVHVVTLLRSLEEAGVEGRLLRTVRRGAERSVDLVDQLVATERARGRSADRERANARAGELGELLADLHREFMRVSLGKLSEQ